MPRVRLHTWMIMVVSAVVAVLMILVRIMVSVDPRRLDAAVDLAIGIVLFSIVYFTPFIGLTIALRSSTGRPGVAAPVGNREKTHVVKMRQPNENLAPHACLPLAFFGKLERLVEKRESSGDPS